MKNIGVIANCRKPDASSVACRLAEAAAGLGMKLFTCDETSSILPDALQITPAKLAGTVEAVLVMGGDGTMLHAVRILDGAKVPLLGINLGGLGFLTSVNQKQITDALEALAKNRLQRFTRTKIVASIQRGDQYLGSFQALNDIVIGWGYSSRIITLDLSIDERPVMTARCDGLIISTPTGSTGHSLSAGGPIIHPDTPAYLVNVVCPHTLSDRPFVLPDNMTVCINVTGTSKDILMAVDGQDQHTILQGDVICVSISNQRVELLNFPGYCYFNLLRHKLHWRGST